MHGMSIDDVTFNYNGDYSGDVLITAPIHDLEHGQETVRVPYNTLKQLVANELRARMIAAAEQMSDDDILLAPADLELETLRDRLIDTEDNEALDDFCHDVASHLGSAANNGGVEEQIEFLLDHTDRDSVVRHLKEILGDE